MSIEIFLALVGFSVATSVSPGPNNLMLLASGVNFGFRPTVPHMLGIGGGFALLLLGVGLGLGHVLQRSPQLYLGLKVASGLYLLYLAYRIATAGPIANSNAVSRPLTFLQAAAFQWVNPKAWVMAVTAMTAYTSQVDDRLSVLIVVAVFAAINLPCVSLWCAFGTGMRRYLSNPKHLLMFNYGMAALLVVSLWPMLA